MPISLRHPVASFNYSAYQQHRFGDRIFEQERVANALSLAFGEDLRAIARRMYCCCQGAMIAIDDETGDVRLHEKRCNARQCTYCSRIRAKKVLSKLMKCVATMDSPRFLTLTVVSSDAPLRERMQHLRDSFARLRRSKAWKQNMLGGVYTTEVSWNAKRKQWHPHIHAIVDGKYWKQSEIADCWQIASDDSRIVDVRFIYNRESQTRYLATYASKSSDLKSVPTDRICEYVEHTRGLRFMQTFGTLHAVKMEEAAEKEDATFTDEIRVDELVTAANDGDEVAKQLLSWLRSGADREFPDGLLAKLSESQPGCKTPAGLVRRWWAIRSELCRERNHSPPTPKKHNRFDNGTERLWKESDNPVCAYHVQ